MKLVDPAVTASGSVVDVVAVADVEQPAKILACTYEEEHSCWRVITEWWPEDSYQGQGGHPAPDMPGHVITQRCVRTTDGATFYPLDHEASELLFEAC